MSEGAKQPAASTVFATGYTALPDCSDEAHAAFTVAVERYATELAARARGQTQEERILKADVDAAVRQMKPTSGRDQAKVFADWAKRTGYLFIGLSIAQFNSIRHQKIIAEGSVSWLVFDLALVVVCLVAGVILDRRSVS
ncbi:hypothetical protein [Streptomyces sp. SCL15-4]|uniref:hypothetical protein n=1 Tax=Streptomyces sp. SCL15-4 TaxID=2967221 RepID=UPI002965D420|nr:hypothetical protein [Streptomyces sp. SCL15-4]